MTVEVVERHEPADTTALLPPYCAGDQQEREFELDLDAPKPRLRSTSGVELPFKVTNDDPERWIIQVATDKVVNGASNCTGSLSEKVGR